MVITQIKIGFSLLYIIYMSIINISVIAQPCVYVIQFYISLAPRFYSYNSVLDIIILLGYMMLLQQLIILVVNLVVPLLLYFCVYNCL